MPAALSAILLEKMDAYWRAANYLTVGQIYLQDNPLLETPLKLEHIKPRLLGHWGTTTGLNFIYVHLVAHSYLEGSYTERYPNIERSRNGMQRLFRQFSWPYGIPSHVAPETPGSIHEGGELGYSLVHAYGAAFDNPELIVACIIGDGEAETGALAASWHSNKFLNPARDGAVLPILHLNGFKIANPTVLARIERGFHGLSCESIMRQLGDNPPDRLIIAHLGNGVSVTAVKNGQSVDTSMGLTPSGGVVMGTRCGDLDPGVLVYLVREKNFDAARLEALIDQRSGLLGISGIDSDMRRLHVMSISSADARLAIRMFCYSIRKQIAAMTSALDGLDMLVFTGGIGEHDAEVRVEICSGLSWVGISLDPAENQSSKGTINRSTSRSLVRVFPSQEDAEIAVHTWELASGIS